MSKPVTKNTPDANAKGGSSKKPSGNNNIFLIILAAVGVIAVIIGLFSMGGGGEKEQKKKQEDASIASAANAPRTAKVYDNQGKRKVERSEAPGAVADQQASDRANGELEFMVEETTGQQMVNTPAGYVPIDSAEGQKFIQDFNNLKQLQNPNAQLQGPAVAAPQVQSQMLDELRQEKDSQIRALDEKVNDLAGQVDTAVSLIKKQNETIKKMAVQIQTIQPIVKTPNELAKELFGKNGTKVLKERNNALKVDVVVGDKAFITDSRGDVHVLRVGEVVPGTSSIVAAIDEANKQVILKQ